MTRILFSSADQYAKVNEAKKVERKERGVKTHSRVGKALHNFFAKIGICSKVVEYTIPSATFSTEESEGQKKTQKVYMNVASFNNWLKACGVNDKINPADIKADRLNNAIAKKIQEALAQGEKQEGVEDLLPENPAAPPQKPAQTEQPPQTKQKTSGDGKKTADPDAF